MRLVKASLRRRSDVACSPRRRSPPPAIRPAGFDAFIAEFKKEAAAKGISRRACSALDGIAVDPSVLAADKRQGVFKQSFEEFSGRMISRDRMTKGLRHMQTHAATLRKVEQQFGVPGAVVVAIWGLETDFGTNLGKKEVIRSVATLAFDCRRTEMFQNQLIDALRIVDRGDLTPAEMRGDWAGDFGQTQFLPSSYLQVRGRLRRRRPPRPGAQRAGRARLHRQLSEGLRLAARPALERRRSELRGDPRLEQGHGLRQDHRGLRRAAGRRRRPRRRAAALTVD